jgi:rRNA pseudouridine-1189 N-methylase Emg1 (Nep1/Mra1 family)
MKFCIGNFMKNREKSKFFNIEKNIGILDEDVSASYCCRRLSVATNRYLEVVSGR